MRKNHERITRLHKLQQYANIIMNAFGNAKTPRNDDSSRFAKMIDVYLDNGGGVTGMGVTDYLLERSRCIRVPEESYRKEDRPYHVFYYLWARDQWLHEQHKKATKTKGTDAPPPPNPPPKPAFTWTNQPFDKDIVKRYQAFPLWSQGLGLPVAGHEVENSSNRDLITDYLRFAELEDALVNIIGDIPENGTTLQIAQARTNAREKVRRIWDVLRFIMHNQQIVWNPEQLDWNGRIPQLGQLHKVSTCVLSDTCEQSVLHVLKCMMGEDPSDELRIEFGWTKGLREAVVQKYINELNAQDYGKGLYETMKMAIFNDAESHKKATEDPTLVPRVIAGTFGLYTKGTHKVLRMRRDNLSKQLYLMLWRYLMRKINTKLGSVSDPFATISVLDIFGFENFTEKQADGSTKSDNGLSQLCIEGCGMERHHFTPTPITATRSLPSSTVSRRTTRRWQSMTRRSIGRGMTPDAIPSVPSNSPRRARNTYAVSFPRSPK